jgi:hypothetical protein
MRTGSLEEVMLGEEWGLAWRPRQATARQPLPSVILTSLGDTLDADTALATAVVSNGAEDLKVKTAQSLHRDRFCFFQQWCWG